MDMLKDCYYRWKLRNGTLKPIRKVTPKQRVRIKENKAYYDTAIHDHGTNLCDNCDQPIRVLTGSHVSHIISQQVNPALYHDPLNHFILCQDCEAMFSRKGQRKTMKIFPEYQRRKVALLRAHYVKC